MLNLNKTVSFRIKSKQMKAKILFLCKDNSIRSLMAYAYAQSISPDDVEICSAGVVPSDSIHEDVIAVMAEKGFDLKEQTLVNLNEIELTSKDIIISLCSEAAESCHSYLPGQPLLINWSVKLPESSNVNDLRQLRDRIFQLTDDFFNRGYFKAITRDILKDSLVLDSLTEGIIVHDIERKIVFFNAAAEEITGFSREEVIGKDCHDVFKSKFCGMNCSFCDHDPSESGQLKYATELMAKSGERKHLEMSVNAIEDDSSKMIGVLASFKDMTKEYSLARRLEEVENFNGIIGKNKKMLEIFELVRSVAESNVPVLVQGESGTGKELIAAAIHNSSPRAKGHFITVNCGALPEGLLESELFGHEKGSFTGAVRDKKGRFELAHGGSIFLDEIGDISPAMQVKLLRVLQEGTFERVGGQKTLQVDVRIISATNKKLMEEIGAGRFREDLYYRLCVVPVYLPPLRERRSDIPLLVEFILKKISAEMNREGIIISPGAMDIFLSYDWPGNVRELQNAIQFSMVKCRTNLIGPDHLPPNLASIERVKKTTRVDYDDISVVASGSSAGGSRRKKLDEESVNEALSTSGGNKVEAARILGVGRATLYRFLNQLKS
ncbi:MAG: sigma 54-interacting transcriptional regulator [Planctomycetota bacterium]|jgi:PAS domain S-box-containing protein